MIRSQDPVVFPNMDKKVVYQILGIFCVSCKTAVTIASELGLSPRTVEKHLEVALKSLKKELKDYLPTTLLLWLFP